MSRPAGDDDRPPATQGDGTDGQALAAPRPWAWARARDVVWTLLGIAGLAYVATVALRPVTSVVLLFVVAALLAFVVFPLVTWLQGRLGCSRTTAALATYLLVGVGAVAAGVWLAARLTAQVMMAVTNLPAAYRALQERLPGVEAQLRGLGLSVDATALQERLLAELRSAGLASQGLAWAAAAGDVVVNAFLVLCLSFYLVVDGDRLLTSLIEISPDRWKAYTLFTEKTLLRVVGGYLRGQLVMGAIIGLAVFLGCLVLDVRYSLILGILGFIFEMVPMVGPILIGAAMTGVALFESLELALVVLGYYVVLQLLESNVLGPRITGNAVGLHPIAALLGLVVGAKVFGLWGALFAVPVLGFCFVVVSAVYRQLRGLDPQAAVARRRPLGGWPGRRQGGLAGPASGSDDVDRPTAP